MANVNVYHFPQVVTGFNPNAVSSATVINRTDFTAFKHVDNDVEFLLKNWDNKPINLTNLTVTIYIVDRSSNTLKHICKPVLTVINAAKGHCRLTLGKQDTVDWCPGYYNFSLTITDPTGKEVPIFVDRSRVIQGYFELFEGPLPQYNRSLVLTPNCFTKESWGTDLTYSAYLVAQAFPGAAQADNRSGVHTIAIYMNNFSGAICVKASLENFVPTCDQEWFKVQLSNGQDYAEFTNYTGMVTYTFTGMYMWLKFVQHLASMNEGEVTQIILKN